MTVSDTGAAPEPAERVAPAVGHDEPTAAASADPAAPGAAPSADKRRRRRARRVLVVLVVVVVLLVLAAAWLAYQVYRAGTALRDAQAKAEVVAELASDGDLSGLVGALPPLQEDLRRARSAVADPVWSAALVVPWLGDQLGAVRTVTVALDDLATTGAPLVAAVDEALYRPGEVGSTRLDLAPLLAAAPAIAAGAQEMRESSAQVAAIETDGLVRQLAGPIDRLQDELPPVADAMDTAARAAALLPGMLGGDGPRTYLVALLNSAELRAQGGIVGAFALLHAQDGALTLGEQQAGSLFGALDEPVLPLTPEELTLQSDRLGRWVQDAVLTPDFPRAAQLLAARWEAETGQRVDGVVATDSTVIAGLLRATGPVTVAGERLAADSVLEQLLTQTYVRLTDPVAADEFFAGVAAEVFGAVAEGQGSRGRAAIAVATAAGEGRLRVWSADPDEQAALAAETVGGAFLSGPYADAVGVFLDDGTAGKLDYYLTTEVSVEACGAGDETATVQVVLAYDPPAEIGALPGYVIGTNPEGLPPGWLQTNVSVYAPVGAPLQAIGLDEGFVSGLTGEAAGRRVQVVTARMAPGDRLTYRVEVPVRDGAVTVWSTPTLTSPGLLTATCAGG